MESLLSTSPLIVAAAPDMDLMSCVDYFIQHCVDGERQIAPIFAVRRINSLVKGNWTQHVLTDADIPRLRRKAEKCLQVRVWSACEILNEEMDALCALLTLILVLIVFAVGKRSEPRSYW